MVIEKHYTAFSTEFYKERLVEFNDSGYTILSDLDDLKDPPRFCGIVLHFEMETNAELESGSHVDSFRDFFRNFKHGRRFGSRDN